MYLRWGEKGSSYITVGTGKLLDDAFITGRGLHTVQDWYSHGGYPWPGGHLIDQNSPSPLPISSANPYFGSDNADDTSLHPGAAMAAVYRSFRLLGGNPANLPKAFIRLVLAEPSAKERTKLLEGAARRALKKREKKPKPADAGQPAL